MDYLKESLTKKSLLQLKNEMEALAGHWNGDESGKLEDQAHICGEIIDHIKDIETLLEELENN